MLPASRDSHTDNRKVTMAATHDYPTVSISPKELDSTHVLVGYSGGLSAVYDVEPSNLMPGMMLVETEHGPLYLDPDEDCEVYDAT